MKARLLALSLTLAFVGTVAAQQQRYDIGSPSADETLMLELVNRARSNPSAEGDWLATLPTRLSSSEEPWTTTTVQAAFHALVRRHPLAFSPAGNGAARIRAADMVSRDYYSHRTPEDPNRDAIDAVLISLGLTGTGGGSETISMGDYSATEFHVICQVDFGNVAPKHRSARMQGNPNVFPFDPTPGREYGVSILAGPWKDGQQYPPFRFVETVISYDPTEVAKWARPIITGVAYVDADSNAFYTPGEGLGGITVTPSVGKYFAVTTTSGAYSIPLENLPANTDRLTLTFSGGALGTRTVSREVVLDRSIQFDVQHPVGVDPNTGQILYQTERVTTVPNVKVDLLLPATDRPAASKVANLSTRVRVESGDNLAIAGLVIGGEGTLKVVIRALGPTLTSFGVAGALTNPTLEVKDNAGQTIASSDDWQSDAAMAAALTDARLAPSSPREAAVVLTLGPGSYTALVRDAGGPGMTGVALVETYAIEGTAKLLNVSTRGVTRGGDNLLIGGLVVTGERDKRIAVRLLSKSMGNFVSGPARGTVFELRREDDGTIVGSFDPSRYSGVSVSGASVAPDGGMLRHGIDMAAINLPLNERISNAGNNDVGGTVLVRPGSYTVLAKVPAGAGEGIVLAEIYDRD